MRKALTNAVCGVGKCALWAAFEAFPLEEPIFSFALGAKVFVEASLTLWSFAFWGNVCRFLQFVYRTKHMGEYNGTEARNHRYILTYTAHFCKTY